MLLEATTIHKDIFKVHNYILIECIRRQPGSSTFKRLMEMFVSPKGITFHSKRPYLVKNTLQC